MDRRTEGPPDTTPDRTPEVNKPSNKAAKHIWFADYSGAAGRLKAPKIWWDTLLYWHLALFEAIFPNLPRPGL